MNKKKKKVTVYRIPKAQDGMEMAPPQQEGGDQMQQLAGEVQQMLEQGAAPEQVVAQLVQGGVPPEAIVQVMASLGMPQEQVVQIVQGVMQQMQGGQEGAPQEGQPMMQGGGEAGQMEQMVAQVAQALEQGTQPQEMIAQLLQQVGDPQAVLQIMAAASGADEQTAMEQIAPMVEQVAQSMQGSQGQPSPQEQMMMHGGITTSNPGSIISPNKADFAAIKKSMLKNYKDGGQTDELDSSSTETYLQNLNGAISNYVQKNLRVGMVNQRYKDNMQKFDALPQANTGTEIKRQDVINQYNLSQDQVAGMDDAKWAELEAEYRIDKGIPDTTTVDNAGDQNQTIPVGTQYGNSVWNGQQWMPTQMGQQQHYYPGHGPGMPQGNYAQQNWMMSPMQQMLGAFGARGTGGYRTKGIGGFQGMGPADIQAQMAKLSGDPNYQFNVEDVTRKRFLGLGKDKVIGKRMTWTPIGSEGAGSIGSAGETVEDINEDTRQLRRDTEALGYDAAESRRNAERLHNERIALEDANDAARYNTAQTRAQTGLMRDNTSNLRIGLENDAVAREEQYAAQKLVRDYEKAQRLQGQAERMKQFEGIAPAEKGSNRIDYASMSNEQLMQMGDKTAARILKQRTGEKMNHGGVTRNNPGGMIWDMDKYGFGKTPQGSLYQAEDGVEMIGRRSFDPAMFTEGAMGVAGAANQFLTAARLNQSSDEATIARSTDNTQQIYEPGSGASGYYDQEGRWIPSDMGAGVRAGTGSDQDVNNSFSGRNFYQDFIPGNGMNYFKHGGLTTAQNGMQVGEEFDFTENEIKELEALGYKISRL